MGKEWYILSVDLEVILQIAFSFLPSMLVCQSLMLPLTDNVHEILLASATSSCFSGILLVNERVQNITFKSFSFDINAL